MSTYPATRGIQRKAYVEQVIVGGVDVTEFRGARTPAATYKTMEPFGYGSATLTFPQVRPFAESGDYGTGDLSWVREGLIVRINACDPDTGEVVHTRYRGRTTTPPSSGGELTWTIGGLWVSVAESRNRQVPVVRQVKDAGWWAWQVIARAAGAEGVHFSPQFGPTTGIDVAEAGGMTELAWAEQVCQLATHANGDQWTIMPTVQGGKAFEFRLKDRTTKHATVYVDGHRVVQNLERGEWFNTYFLTGTRPDGLYWDGLVLPGVEQEDDPPAFPGTLSLGDSGEDVRTLNFRLVHLGLMTTEEASYDYDAETVEAVEDVQERADLNVTGVVNKATWDALFDIGVHPWTLAGARIEPLVQDNRVRRWSVSPNGTFLALNPNYDPTIIRRDRNVDFGFGVTMKRAKQWAKGQMARLDENTRVGTITLPRGGAVIAGEHNPGDPTPTSADVIAAEDVQAGWNLWLANHEGGTLVHVSEVEVSASNVTLTVDTGYRDAYELAEIIARNRDSRRDLRREWVNEHRGSTRQRDAGQPAGHYKAGFLWRRVFCEANKWTVFPVFAGRAGTVSKLRIETENSAGVYCMAIFADRIGRGVLAKRVGDPFGVDDDGETVWSDPALEDFYANRFLVYSAGDEEQPCGYWPRKHTNRNGETTTHAITGVWQDDASFGYYTLDKPALWVAVYSDRDTWIKRGRIMWAQLEYGA